MTHSVSYTKQDGIGIVTVNNPPVNALSQHVRQGLHECFNEANEDDTVAVVLICDGRTFIAGADISEFGRPSLAAAPDITRASYLFFLKPVIAAIHGTALGSQPLTWLQALATLVVTGSVFVEILWPRLSARR